MGPKLHFAGRLNLCDHYNSGCKIEVKNSSTTTYMYATEYAQLCHFTAGIKLAISVSFLKLIKNRIINRNGKTRLH